MAATITRVVEINEQALASKFSKLINDDTTMLEIHNLLAKMCDPYVPFLEGPLSQTIEVTPEYVRYTQPYAHYQYNGDGFNFTRDYHPLASAHWDDAMMRDHREEFVAQVKQILLRRANELYG